MVRGLSNNFNLTDKDHFMSLMRMFDENKKHYCSARLPYPTWIEKSCDYSHTKHRQAGVHDLNHPDLAVQRRYGVLINKPWTSEMKDPAHLAQYCAFKSIRELSSYVDVITSQADQDFQNFIEPLNKDCHDSQMQRRHTKVMMIDYIDPLEVLIAYNCCYDIREFTNNVAKLCTKPTFIPVLNKYVSEPLESCNISPYAFILAHAVQILLFSPQDWDPYRVYSRDQGAYAHRFPTPETIGGGTTPVVAGLFSMEDLYRAILLFYYLLKRRSVSQWITKTAPTSSSNAEFPGYHRPAPPSVDQGTHRNPNEPMATETSPAALNELPKANEMIDDSDHDSDQDDSDQDDSDQDDSDQDDSDQDEDRSDLPEEDANESEGAREDENEAEQEAEQPKKIYEEADTPESLNEREIIEGLKTMSINTLILESLTTTRPSESLSQRLRDLGKSKAPSIASDGLVSELRFLHEHHMLPDFASEISTSTKNDTHVPFDLGVSDMKHLIKRSSVTSTESETTQPSPLVLVEECRYQWDIPQYPEINDLGHVQLRGQKNHPMSESPEHRKAVLTSFDWRNKTLLGLEEPPFLTTVDNARSVMEDLLNPELAESQVEGFGSEEVTTLINAYEKLRDDQTCGLRLLFDQAIGQRSRHAPTDRMYCIRWVCYYNPIMTRALEVANKYCVDGKERLVVYVEDPWIQCITVALFVVAGFNVGSIRSSDTCEEQVKIIEQWKNKASGLGILVANLDTKVRDINVHTDCTKGLLLNWTLEPERMLKIINNMSGTSQKGKPIFHKVKVVDTYHDVIERVCCTKWAMQLSKDIKLPEWMTGVIREICIFELIKSTWHQEFNRYAWVVAHDLKGLDFEYHDPKWRQLGHVFSIVAKLVLHHPGDKELWVESMPNLVELCFHFNDAFDVSDFLGHRLSLTLNEMRTSFLPIFKGIKSARAAVDDEEASERRERLQRGVEARARDDETVAHRGEKRKAGDDGGGGAKKQKISAA
ncbi:hypothetical protein F52700_8341 [Fusarium sp. NRRL 52700]|nr:hypothetical protein F52700_8341 [Fusarium sp. NRRL 52700]